MIYSFFQALFSVVDMVAGLYVGIILIECFFSWMMAYDIISIKDKRMDQVQEMLNKLTAPFLNIIRRKLPTLGGLDFSPIIAVFILVFIQKFLRSYGLSI